MTLESLFDVVVSSQRPPRWLIQAGPSPDKRSKAGQPRPKSAFLRQKTLKSNSAMPCQGKVETSIDQGEECLQTIKAIEPTNERQNPGLKDVDKMAWLQESRGRVFRSILPSNYQMRQTLVARISRRSFSEVYGDTVVCGCRRKSGRSRRHWGATTGERTTRSLATPEQEVDCPSATPEAAREVSVAPRPPCCVKH